MPLRWIDIFEDYLKDTPEEELTPRLRELKKELSEQYDDYNEYMDRKAEEFDNEMLSGSLNEDKFPF